MPQTETTGISHEQRLALARLAEILVAAPPRDTQLKWIHDKNGIEFIYYWTATSVATRTTLFNCLREAYWSGRFRHWFVDVLKEYQRELWERHPTKWLSLQNVRRDIMHGGFEWGSGIRALAILGFELVEGKDLFGEETLVVLPSVGGALHAAETSKLRDVLSMKHPQALAALQGAYEAYSRGGVDDMRGACEGARNALENVVKDITGDGLGPGLQTLSKDSESRKDMLLQLRDFLAARGPHNSEQPSEEDTLLALRLTEQVLVWALKRVKEW
jgi:hypothetical protein